MRVGVIENKRIISKFTGKPGGNTYGYYTGVRLLKRALESVGVEINPDAKIQIHYTSPHFYSSSLDKVNVIYTMWETEDLPSDLWDAFIEADYVIVPSENSRTAILKAGIQTPVFVCHHGIDTEFFTYTERVYKPPCEPFCPRFLWVGAPNIRKGYDLVVKAFYWAFCKPNVEAELYIKSSLYRKQGEETYLRQFRTIIDTRNLSPKALLDLYKSAHVFLYPSRGEGAGLPPLEAMSTGLSVVAPPFTGMQDYIMESHAYPLRYILREANYGVSTKVAESDLDFLINILVHIYYNLGEAMEKGKKASNFVREHFSLEVMGKRLYEILQEIGE